MESEFSFPRGGEKTSGSSRENNNISKHEKNHDGTVKTGTCNGKMLALFDRRAEDLSYKELREQMLILGCVREITALSLDLELPGNMRGMVKITSISEYYSQLLEQQIAADNLDLEKDVARLNKMFHVGQFLPTKVMEKPINANGTKIQLSINPEDINAQLNHRVFKRGLVIWAAVLSKLDHGYQLDAGVKNTTIFLPFRNVYETNLVVGQPMWCFVEKCNVTSLTANMRVSILEEHLKSAVQTDLSLGYVLPGMQFYFRITKSAKYRLEGVFMKKYIGCIKEPYLASSLEKTSKYKATQVLKASLLYVDGKTEFSSFTLKNLGGDVLSVYENGKILRAQISSKVLGGLNIVFPNKEVGFVSYKRLLKMLPQSANMKDVIKKRFPLGSSHQCRILDYSLMQKLYICTFDQSKQDITIGKLVKVKVEKITSEGLQVLIGKLHGFITNIHLFDSEYSEKNKTKFTEGQILQARVVNNDQEGIYLTLKESLVNSKQCLSTADDPACNNRQYPGVIVHKSARGLLIFFYGGLGGMIYRTQLKEIYPDYTEDMFYIGEVITPTIIKINDNSFHLSLKPPNQIHEKPKITVGKYVDVVVVKNDENGLEVEVTPHNIPAFIPNAHLSTSLGLNYLLRLTYKIGDTIEGVLCVQSRSRKPILSLREAMAYKSQNLEIKNAEDIQLGSIVRCEYESSDDTGIYVSTLCVSQVLKFKIPNQGLVLDKKDLKELKFEPHQPLLAKITKLSSNSKIESARAILEDVFSYNYEYSLNLWEQYLKDSERIRTYLLEQESPFAKLELGDHVRCSVTAVENGYCTVIINGFLRGLVTTNHFPKNVSVGIDLVGIVLWVNYEDQFVEVSLNVEVIKKVNNVQDGNIDKPFGSTVFAEILTACTNYAIGVLRDHDTNRQLVFLPPKLHENDFMKEINYEYNKIIEVVICRKVNNKLIVMNQAHVSIIKNMEKERKKERKVSRVAKKTLLGVSEPEVQIIEISSDDDYNEETIHQCSSRPILPGVSEPEVQIIEISSDDGYNEEIILPKKKKKLSAPECNEIAFNTGNAGSNEESQKVDQFQELVKGKPNCSKSWSKYIMHLTENAELDKARTVAREALRTIDFNLTEEILNIWILCLNLENTYGDKSTFEKIFREAIRCSNDQKIYLSAIKIMADSQKWEEMEKKIQKAKKKFKQVKEMWIEIGRIYYMNGKLKEARNLKYSALQALQSKPLHIELIIDFAIMEFQYGQKKRGKALFKTVLQYNPKQIDIFSRYIDQLIKKGDLEAVRPLIEHAKYQDIPSKKLNSLLQKYSNLE